ncbi:Aste57867_15177 [Aphanomyces stellatus]|uniref:Aste57867_15177 protein n=1 Tax=Aphanomyces stellatus TaxID=120398 RepID=A0A485L2J0_9STRA|nr:hypothetical protein As57867_015121 [Aphanomyces stellatus]VFT91986.1 Aste57867_15177 [Aphanomyces stellatus]
MPMTEPQSTQACHDVLPLVTPEKCVVEVDEAATCERTTEESPVVIVVRATVAHDTTMKTPSEEPPMKSTPSTNAIIDDDADIAMAATTFEGDIQVEIDATEAKLRHLKQRLHDIQRKGEVGNASAAIAAIDKHMLHEPKRARAQ